MVYQYNVYGGPTIVIALLALFERAPSQVQSFLFIYVGPDLLLLVDGAPSYCFIDVFERAPREDQSVLLFISVGLVLLLQVGEVVGSAGTEGAARQTNKTMYNGKVCVMTTPNFSSCSRVNQFCKRQNISQFVAADTPRCYQFLILSRS